MVTKKTGISRDLIIHPGETISDILEERGITRAELAVRTGVSPAYVTNVLSGKKGISTKFAMALEYALDVPKSFWINLQANYEIELLDYYEESTVTDAEFESLKSMDEVVSYLKSYMIIPNDETKKQTVLSLRKIFGVSNLANISGLHNVDTYISPSQLEKSADTKTFDIAYVDNLIVRSMQNV